MTNRTLWILAAAALAAFVLWSYVQRSTLPRSTGGIGGASSTSSGGLLGSIDRTIDSLSSIFRKLGGSGGTANTQAADAASDGAMI